jgi:hypothetical protein
MGVCILKLRWLLDKHPGQNIGRRGWFKLRQALLRTGPHSIRGTTALRLRHTHPEPPTAAHYAEDDVGEGKSVDVYPRCSGYCALPARRIAATIWRMLASGDTMST